MVPFNLRHGIRLFVAFSDPAAGKAQLNQVADALRAKIQAGANAAQMKTLLAEVEILEKQVHEDQTAIVPPSYLHQIYTELVALTDISQKYYRRG